MKNKKMLYMVMISLVVVFLIIMIVIAILSIGGRRLSYEKIESKLKSASITYFENHKDELPKNNGSIVEVDSKTLSDSGLMKPLNKIEPKGSNCSGKVIVVKNGDNYLYSPILKCGDDYNSSTLYEYLTDKSNIVITGSGLYANENGYVFKGENVKNFVKLGNTLWAIIDIDSNGYMRMIYISGGKKIKTAWDDRYNINKSSNVGINDYNVSRIRDFLLDSFNLEYFVNIEDLVYITPKKWCIGKRSNSNTNINNLEECEEKSEEQIFGLPYVSDAYVASIDPNCHDTNDISCENYNYLTNYVLSSWTLTGVKESSYEAYYIVTAEAVPTKASTNKNIMPTVYLSANAMYASGDGSIENPFLLK